MANHVMTFVEVLSDEPKVFEKLKEMFDGHDWQTLQDTMFLYNVLYGSSEYDRGDYTDKIGAKWAHIENVEAYDEAFQMSTCSAWYYIENAIERLGEILFEIDNDVVLQYTFEDESLDPIGGGGWYKNEMITYDDTYEWPDDDADDYDEQMDDLWENVHHIQNELMEEAVRDLMDDYGDE